ncbi:MAG: tetratricopeptide repeat protein [Chloroflexota bacterium]|nr:tetratricopeptide repeat protein [Chloroflexota bacterium]
MAGDQAREMRAKGIAAAKAGSKDEARQLLQQSVRLEPRNEAAWLWLASVARDSAERRFCLEQVISINPGNATAQQALDALTTGAISPTPMPPSSTSRADASAPSIRSLSGISPIKPLTPTTPASSSPFTNPPSSPRPLTPTPSTATFSAPVDAESSSVRLKRLPGAPAYTPTRRLSEQEIMAQPAGIPQPPPERITDAHKQIDRLMLELNEPLPNYTWTRKRGGRAGEGDIIVYRAYVTAGIVALLVILGVVSVFVYNTNADVRLIVSGPSATPTVTPSVTPTNTPGLTPTPSPTPQRSPTVTPTLPFDITPGDPYAPPRATAIYPRIEQREIVQAFNAIQAGQPESALPTLAAERENAPQFEPNPYYYEALAYLALDDADSALDTLQEAEGRLEERPNEELRFRPLIELGFAQAYWKQASDADAAGNTAAARDLLALVREYATAAREGDERLEEPYILLANADIIERDFDSAVSIIDEGLAVTTLRQNTRLIMTKAEAYYQQREFGLATYQAFLARTIDPATEPAYRLQIQIALDQNRPGQAVLYAQDYLYYYPGSTLAWQLLGDAHAREGSIDLALQTYTQGLAGETDDPASINMLVGRGRLYTERGRYDLAREDFTRALTLSDDDPTIQALRMEAAYRDGRYQIALEDVLALRGSGVVPDAQLDLLRGRALIDNASSNTEYNQAIGILTALDRTALDAASLAALNEYTARGQYALRNYTAAQTAIDAALTNGETGFRRFLRGQILEALGDRADARREYEWVVSWSQIVPFAFADEARERLDALG